MARVDVTALPLRVTLGSGPSRLAMDDVTAVIEPDGRRRLLTPLFGVPMPPGTVRVTARPGALHLHLEVVGLPAPGTVPPANDVLTLFVVGDNGAALADRLNAAAWRAAAVPDSLPFRPSRCCGTTMVAEWVECGALGAAPAAVALDPLAEFEPLSAPMRRFVRLPLAALRALWSDSTPIELVVDWDNDAPAVAAGLAARLRLDVALFADRVVTQDDGFLGGIDHVVDRERDVDFEVVGLVDANGARIGRAATAAGIGAAGEPRRQRTWHAGSPRRAWPPSFTVAAQLESRVVAEVVDGDAPAPLVRRGAPPLPCAKVVDAVWAALLRCDYLELVDRLDLQATNVRLVRGLCRGRAASFPLVQLSFLPGREPPVASIEGLTAEVGRFLTDHTPIGDRVVVRLLERTGQRRLAVRD